MSVTDKASTDVTMKPTSKVIFEALGIKDKTELLFVSAQLHDLALGIVVEERASVRLLKGDYDVYVKIEDKKYRLLGRSANGGEATLKVTTRPEKSSLASLSELLLGAFGKSK